MSMERGITTMRTDILHFGWLSSFPIGDDDALAAMRVAFAAFGLVVEPGGAIALAAVISGRFPSRAAPWPWR